MLSLQKAYRKALLHAEKARSIDAEGQHEGGMDRRKFIGAASLTGAAIGLSGLLEACQNTTGNNKFRQPSVAIIGAGIAGLHAAHLLYKWAGIKADVYEASSRTGGRILTAAGSGGFTTECGGEFIDSIHADMLNLIEEFNLEKIDCVRDADENNWRDHLYFFKGRKRSEEEIIKEFRKMTGDIQKGLDAIENATDISAWDSLSIADYLKKFNLEDWFYELMYWTFTSEYGLDASESDCLNLISLIAVGTRQGFEVFGKSDERYKVKGGNQKLTDALAGVLKKRDQVHLDHVLESIAAEGDEYLLKFTNGKTVKVQYLLLAIPFSVLRGILKRSSFRFSAKKQHVIDALGYGTGAKMFLAFKDRVWRKQGSTGYVLNDVLQNGWDSSQMQNGNEGRGVYTVFMGGEAGARLKNSKETADRYLTELNRIFPGVGTSYDDSSRSIFNWTDYPFSLGSYSCYRPGQWKDVMGHEITPEGNVFFAGEHCSENFQGFMNGGAETGRIAAENLLGKICANAMQDLGIK
jgi:monoamine oxidase